MTTRRSKFRVAVVLPALACAAAENARGEEMIAPPAFTWRGFHVGASFGGGLAPRPGAMGFRNGLGSLPDALWSLPGGGGGVLGGVQAGYDYAFGPLVLGVEADWQAAGLGGGSRAIGGGAEPLAFLATRSAIDWFGTLRGRVGYSVLPRLLVYGSGGLAYGGGGDLLTYSDAEGREAESVKNTTRLGFSVGGGFEWAFRPAWSVRLDYLYVDLGRGPGHVARLESEEEEEGPPVFVTLAGAPKRFHALRASLNYRFNFLGGAEVDARPDEKFASEGEKAPEISTHYLFGFTYGTDIETEGKGEILSITRMDFGKRAALPALEPEESPRLWPGSSFYRATLQTLEFEHTLTDRLQYALGVIGANHNIRGVRGIEDIQNTSLKGLLGEFRYILLKRGVDAPIGVALHVEPRWGVRDYGGRRDVGRVGYAPHGRRRARSRKALRRRQCDLSTPAPARAGRKMVAALLFRRLRRLQLFSQSQGRLGRRPPISAKLFRRLLARQIRGRRALCGTADLRASDGQAVSDRLLLAASRGPFHRRSSAA
jgi:outer membrane immunogenic protein